MPATAYNSFIHSKKTSPINPKGFRSDFIASEITFNSLDSI